MPLPPSLRASKNRSGAWLRALAVVAMLVSASVLADDEALAAQLKAHAGKIVYVDFWASWCGPCAQSFPWLNQMQAKYGDRLAIVAVNLDSDAAAAQAFLKLHPAHFEVLYDPAGQLAERYRIDGMPSTVILDAGGHIAHQHSGFLDARRGDYEAAIRSVIDSSSISTGSAP